MLRILLRLLREAAIYLVSRQKSVQHDHIALQHEAQTIVTYSDAIVSSRLPLDSADL